MRFIIRFLYFLFLVFLIRWLLRSIFPSWGGRGRAPGGEAPSPKDSGKVIVGRMEKDPICGMYVDAASALKLSRGGQEYFFCSSSCRDQFSASQRS